MSRILITEFMDAASVETLAASHTVRYDATLVDRPDELRAAVADAEAIIVRNRTKVEATLLAAAPRLRVVGRLGVGLDNIELPACAARNIEVIPATGANALAVVEYVIFAAMLLLRRAIGASGETARGDWPRASLSEGRELAGKTLGIVGFGGIGARLATLAQALGVEVIGCDAMVPDTDARWARSNVAPRTLDMLLEEADIVSLHVPLDAATRHLLDASRIARMKRDAVLINTARGGVVDETALAAALREGRLAGAALDVFEQEPLRAGSVLADCPNLLLTPHIAGVTAESNVRVSSLVAHKVAAALAR
ncbi:MAG: hydroxyacid dehydrogenase [Casimicrobiaceae bacterium]